MKHVGPRAIEDILGGYAGVVFVRHPAAGALILVATFAHPPAGVAGLLAAVAGWTAASALRLSPKLFRLCVCNALLVGLSLGAVFPLSLPLASLLVVAAALASWLAAVLADLLWRAGRLPALSLAFVLVTLAASFAAHANLGVGEIRPAGGDFLGAPWDGFLTALGAAYFSPYPPAGLAVLAAILASSRFLGVLALAGYALGQGLFALWAGDGADVMGRWGGFNFVLSAMALGGVFAVPGPAAFAVAMAGAAGAALIAAAGFRLFVDFGLPTLALPFVSITLLLLAALRLRVKDGGPALSLERPDLPERLLEKSRLARARGTDGRAVPLALPFFGEWQVTQGFDSAPTHGDAWRHALDFEVRVDGRCFHGAGRDAGDFYCFGLPVLAPAAGRVVACRDDLPDNLPGESDLRHNWGNFALVHLYGTLHVLLAHLRQGSLKVRAGDVVGLGQTVAACGSSGRSPQAHLHLHVQDGEALGSPTVPFFLSCALIGSGAGRTFRLVSVPASGESVEAPAGDGRLARAMHLPAGRTLVYRVREGEEAPWQRRELRTVHTLLGERQVESDGGARAGYEENPALLAFFDRAGSRDPFFDLWLLALGVTPLGESVHAWEDAPPLRLLPLPLAGRLLAGLRHPLGAAIGSRYARAWEQKAGVWRQTARHELGLPGRRVVLETEAEIEPARGCVAIGAALGSRRWRAELIETMNGS